MGTALKVKFCWVTFARLLFQLVRLIETHHVQNSCLFFPTSDFTVEIDERKRFSRVVCNFIVVVEFDKNFEVKFFVGFELDTTGKDGSMFTIGYLDHVRRPDEVVNRLSVFCWIVHNFVLFTFSVTQLHVAEEEKSQIEYFFSIKFSINTLWTLITPALNRR